MWFNNGRSKLFFFYFFFLLFFFFSFSYKMLYGKWPYGTFPHLISCRCVWDLTDVWSSNWLSLLFPSPVISTSFLPFLPVKSVGAGCLRQHTLPCCVRTRCRAALSLPKKLSCIFLSNSCQHNRTKCFNLSSLWVGWFYALPFYFSCCFAAC